MLFFVVDYVDSLQTSKYTRWNRACTIQIPTMCRSFVWCCWYDATVEPLITPYMYIYKKRTAYAIILPLFCNTVDDCYGDEAAADVVAAVHADVVEDKDVDDDAMHILMIVHEIQPIYDSKF